MKPDKLPFKTLVFKAYLTNSQKETVDSWMSRLKWVWNQGLELLIELDTFASYSKGDKTYYPCCPIPWETHWEKDNKDNWQSIRPFSRIADKKGIFSCPLPQYGKTPRLKNSSYFSLASYFAGKNHLDKSWFTEIPSCFVRGALKSLSKAWDEYKKGKRKRPKFKGKYDKITSLINEDAKATQLSDRHVTVTKLGKIKTDNTLNERWINNVKTSVLKICKKASGYYIQLSGEIPYNLPDANDKAVGLDVGLKYVFATSDGETIDPPKFLRKSEKRLKRLGRSLSRSQKGSNREAKKKIKIARQHEKVADQRRLFNHALSTKIVSDYGAIAVEDLKIPNLMRRSKKKEKADGSGFEHNRAAQKSGLNKSFADNGLGQLLGFMETKSQVTGGEFVRVNPAYTSQECSQCKTIVKKSLSTRTHVCTSCGYTEDRDVNAAINILQRGVNLFKKSYPSSIGKVTDEEIALSVDEPSNYPITSIMGNLELLPSKDLSDLQSRKSKRKRRSRSKPRECGTETFIQLSLVL